MMKKPIYFSHTCHPITKEMLWGLKHSHENLSLAIK
jgi:hypothetical protein